MVFPLLESLRGGFSGDSSSVCSKFSVLPDTCPQDSMNGDTRCPHDLDRKARSESLDRSHGSFGLFAQQHAQY